MIMAYNRLEKLQTKYADIGARLRLVIDKSRETGESGKDYPHSSAEITKDKVMKKLKNTRKKYRNAVDTGKKSGQGRVVLLYFNECEKILQQQQNCKLVLKL